MGGENIVWFNVDASEIQIYILILSQFFKLGILCPHDKDLEIMVLFLNSCYSLLKNETLVWAMIFLIKFKKRKEN